MFSSCPLSDDSSIIWIFWLSYVRIDFNVALHADDAVVIFAENKTLFVILQFLEKSSSNLFSSSNFSSLK